MRKKKKGNKNQIERTTTKSWRINLRPERTNKIYGNCKVYSPAGNLIFLCLRKKANWYLDRKDDVTGEPLAIEIKHINPIVSFLMTMFFIRSKGMKIQFTFEPKEEGNHGDKYSLAKKHNKCVVTGSKNLETLTKHHITPYCYRKYMSDDYKVANSHDIVPIDSEEHFKYERIADNLKHEIARKYDAPIDGVKIEVNHKLFYAIKAAKAIGKHGDKIPKEKTDFYKEKIREYTGKKKVTQKIIDELINTAFGEAGSVDLKTHGEIVMEKLSLKGDDAMQEFFEMWRRHFIKHAKPKYMPKYWDVKRTASRAKIQKKLNNMKETFHMWPLF